MASSGLIFYCPRCNQGYVEGVPEPCPVCRTMRESPRQRKERERRERLADPEYMVRQAMGRKKRGGGCISAAKRLRVYKRDGFACVECGYTGANLTLDHKVPRSKGGTDAESNLQTMCQPCNAAKADSVPDAL